MSVLKGVPVENGAIAIIAPSSPFNRNLLMDGIKKLRSSGFDVKYDAQIFTRDWNELTYFVGSPRMRAEEIMRHFMDDSVGAIIAARGGYGSNMVAELLDFEVIRKKSKIFMGFSDLTFLLNSLCSKAGLITFHGPMIGTYRFLPMIGEDYEILLRILRDPYYKISTPILRENMVRVKQIIEGQVVGGNLTLLTTMTGTPYDFATDDKILFLEDTNEAAYRIDRMLAHLRQAGKFLRAKAIIFGEMLACGVNREIMMKILNYLGIDLPVVFDFPAGHGERNVVIPVGGYCKIDPTKNTITMKVT